MKQLLAITASTIVVASVASAQNFSYTASYSGPGPSNVLVDTFSNGSVVNNNAGQPVNFTSTSYDVNAPKAGQTNQTITAGDLQEGVQASSSAFTEEQALFTSRANAVVLGNTGDYIDFIMEFTDTANVIGPGNNADHNELTIGLFDSGGTAPLTANLATLTSETGGSQNWKGYYSAIFQANGNQNSGLFYRGIQNTGTGDQSLTITKTLINGGYFGSTYALINGSQSSSINMTNASQYTEDFRVTMSAPGVLTISNEVFSGIGTTGMCDYAFGGYTNASDFTFDGLAFSITDKGSFGPTQDISLIDITTNVPEPSTWLLIISGFGVVLAMVSRRRQ